MTKLIFTAAVFFSVLLLCEAALYAGRTPSLQRFGPFNVMADSGFEPFDEQSAANHQWKTTLEEGRIQVLASPEFFTVSETQNGVPGLMAAMHEIWLLSYGAQYSGRITHSDNRTPPLKDGSFSSTVFFEEEGADYIIRRGYRWFPRHRMVLVVELRSGPEAAKRLEGYAEQIDRAISSEDHFEVSPCVKTFYMGQRFNRLQKAGMRGRPDAAARSEMLKTGLSQEVKEHAHHCWSHFYLLAYMEGFDGNGNYLPAGRPREKAQGYLSQAESLHPGGEVLSLELEDLPSLWPA